MHLNQPKLKSILVLTSCYLSFFIGSLIPAIIPIILSYKEIYNYLYEKFKNNTLLLCFFILCCIFISITNIKSAGQFIIYCLLMIGIGKIFKESYTVFLKQFIVSIAIFTLTIFIFAQPLYPEYHSWFNILTLQTRLWVKLFTVEINPNTIGLWSAIAFLLTTRSKKYLYSLFFLYPLFLSQSRAAFLLIIVYYTFLFLMKKHENINIIFEFKKLIISLFIVTNICVFSSLIGQYSNQLNSNEKYKIHNIPIINRFAHDGLNKRSEFFIITLKEIKLHFPFTPSVKTINKISSSGIIVDSLYLNMLLKFGIIGLFFIFYLFYRLTLRIKNRDDTKMTCLVLAFFILGFIEASFLGSLLIFCIFIVALSSTHNINYNKI